MIRRDGASVSPEDHTEGFQPGMSHRCFGRSELGGLTPPTPDSGGADRSDPGDRDQQIVGPVLLPQRHGVAGGVSVALVGCGDVVEHRRHFPGEGVEIDPTGPEPGPTSSSVTDPDGPTARIFVAVMASDDLSDRRQARSTQLFQVRPTTEQWLREGVTSGCPPQIREHPRP